MILIAVLHDLIDVWRQNLIGYVGWLENLFKLFFWNSAAVVSVKRLEHVLKVNLVVENGVLQTTGNELVVVDTAIAVGVDGLEDLIELEQGGVLFLLL